MLFTQYDVQFKQNGMSPWLYGDEENGKGQPCSSGTILVLMFSSKEEENPVGAHTGAKWLIHPLHSWEELFSTILWDIPWHITKKT